MKKFILRPAIALLTFIMGVSVVGFWFVRQHSPENVPAPAVTVSSTKIDRRWVYINGDLKWENAPKELEYPLQHCENGRLIIFYPSGEFASVSVGLERNPKSKMMWMVPGGGFYNSKGTWVRNENGTIKTTSRFSGGNKIVIRRDGTSTMFVQSWVIRNPSSERVANVLESDGRIYIPLEDNLTNFDFLSEMLAADTDWQ